MHKRFELTQDKDKETMMKSSLMIGVLVVLAGLAAPGARADVIAVAYPTFAQGGNLYNGIQQGWNTGTSQDDGYAGDWQGNKWVWRKWSRDASYGPMSGPEQALTALYEANKTYTLTFNARIDSGTGSTVAFAFRYLPAGGLFGYQAVALVPAAAQNFTVASTTEWTPCSFSYTAPASGVSIGRNISLWFDFPDTNQVPGIWLSDVTLSSVVVPEPGALALLAAGLAGLCWRKRR